MTAAALILYGAAFVCFVVYTGGGTVFRLNPLGLGLTCVALLWFLQVLVPLVSR